VDGRVGMRLAGARAILPDHRSGPSAAADPGDGAAVDGQHVVVGACAEGEHSRDLDDDGDGCQCRPACPLAGHPRYQPSAQQ
jgi:hypothetical protein